ncbi:MAG: CHAP domain-containing protein, partial [Ktedonobacteraceae bacterium]
MPFFDNASYDIFPTGLDLKQIAPTLPAEAHFSAGQADLSNFVEQEPMLSTSTSPKVTSQLLFKITHQLTSSLASISEPGTPRLPLVIKGETKRFAHVPAPLSPAEQRQRQRAVSLTEMGFFLLLLILMFLTATPLGHDVGSDFQPLSSNLFRYTFPGSNLIVQATAMALDHQLSDGYDPFSYRNQSSTDGLFSLNWPFGQCTYWANLRYHELTGYWVPWTGNAAQWVASARATPGWYVSRGPQVPSIIVLMPGVQGAGRYGHVAVVEGINPDGSVRTSNMNWYNNGGGWSR